MTQSVSKRSQKVITSPLNEDLKKKNNSKRTSKQHSSQTLKKTKTDLSPLKSNYNDENKNSPEHWETVYCEIKKMRETIASNAPVDTMGCDVAADKNTRRLQTLISLILSSQTKDTANAIAMKALKQKLPGGLTLKSLIEVDEEVLNDLIRPVGFHNRKVKYIKETVKILERDYNGDIPSTIEDLIALPGVGLKMAHLCLSCAWNRTEGIGVDVHVHRISNLLGWVNTKTPEQTRLKLESWLPKKYWKEINHLFVGFGQTICLPRGRKCSLCTLSSLNLCPSSIKESGVSSYDLKKTNKDNKHDTLDQRIKEETEKEHNITDVEDLI
ncbi:hypothetical protein PORY_002712 [Pneumocystis oryctolagi]|uniref:Uncharacterized protein n=1 Tax=Pneumocystis oryctolagi TaxID=42067 RepID=A0ACB7CA50_9ASCO|nr:hypothetical protein PORY_002712 [Pneumocystis oryctolagi]